MRRATARRRLRVRRKRKGETFGRKLVESVDVVSLADAVAGPDMDVGAAAEVVGHMGCCVIEAMAGAAVLLALLTVPAYLLIR